MIQGPVVQGSELFLQQKGVLNGFLSLNPNPQP